MRVFGIGIDIIEVERIEAAVSEFGERFLGRVFTRGERDYCDAQRHPARHYAARWAAKEAVSKALGTGIGREVGWLDMEVVRGASGAPRLVLHGRGREFAGERGVREVKISLAHARLHAAANAVALCEGGGKAAGKA